MTELDQYKAHVAVLREALKAMRTAYGEWECATCLEADKAIASTPLASYEELKKLREELAALKAENATAWAQAHRLALELECLLLDTKDNAIVSKWWDSGMEALSEYQQLKPGAKEDAEAWAKMRMCNGHQ